MKITHEKPEIYETLRAKFGIDWNKGIIITYKGNIYCKTDISEDLVVHESVHIKQQSEDPEWWDKYLADINFRLAQEVEAYRAQYNFIKENYDRNTRRNALKRIASDLSSSIYGNIISFEDAKNIIK